ncbi:MAG: hypothetical protein J5666_00860 [Bacilli bacterium]|nr:hypothetical protein [Bacilli bacterium]
MKKGLIFLSMMLLILLVGCEYGQEVEPTPTGKEPTRDFTVDEYYQDGAIIQQLQEFVIKGQSEEGVLLKASLYDQNGYIVKQISDLADATGSFQMTMTAPAASFNEYRLIITDSVHTHEIDKILFGEVWVMMGERNIATPEITEELANPGLKFLKRTNIGLLWCDELSPLVYGLCVDLAHHLLQKLNVPIAIVDATLIAGHADAWLDKDIASKHKVILNYLDKIERSSLLENDHINSDEPGSMYNSYIKPLEGHGFKGIWWSQGQSDYASLSATDYTQTGYVYSYIITQIFSDQILSKKGLEFFTIQDGYHQEAYSNALRSVQATCAYQLNDMGIIPTYDIVKIEQDEENEEEVIVSFDYEGYVERIFDITYENVYRNKKNYYAPSYVNVVANQENITISFNTGITLEKVDEIHDLKIIDSEGEEVEFTFTINNNYLYLVMDLTDEVLGTGFEYSICYAQDETLYLGNLKATTGIPVLPFIININE